MTRPTPERLHEIRYVRLVTPDSDPWEAGVVSDLLAEIDALRGILSEAEQNGPGSQSSPNSPPQKPSPTPVPSKGTPLRRGDDPAQRSHVSRMKNDLLAAIEALREEVKYKAELCEDHCQMEAITNAELQRANEELKNLREWNSDLEEQNGRVAIKNQLLEGKIATLEFDLERTRGLLEDAFESALKPSS